MENMENRKHKNVWKLWKMAEIWLQYCEMAYSLEASLNLRFNKKENIYIFLYVYKYQDVYIKAYGPIYTYFQVG